MDSFSAGTNEKGYEEAKAGYSEIKEYYLDHPSTHLAYGEFLCAVAFLRIGIGSTTRVALSFPKIKRRIIRITSRDVRW
jgi:hypothetical protein